MELRKLQRISLADALRGMEVGEVCIAPDNTTANSVKGTCNYLKGQGYEFTTSIMGNDQIIKRLK